MNEEDIEVIEAEIVEVDEEFNLEKTEDVYIDSKKEYTTLRVVIDSNRDNMHVNFGLPLAFMSMFGNVSAFMPQTDMLNKSGFSFSSFDFKKLLNDIESGKVVNPLIFKQDLGKDGMIKVFVE